MLFESSIFNADMKDASASASFLLASNTIPNFIKICSGHNEVSKRERKYSIAPL